MVILSAAASSQTRRAEDSSPDVILITVDTLRADHLACYGYKQIQTPNIDKLSADGVRFTQAISQCPITLPSHCSILTGTLPLFHGVRDNSGYRLPAHVTTLAEILKSSGYRTGAFVGAYVLNPATGLNHGFDTYMSDFKSSDVGEMNLSIAEHPAQQVMSQALTWLKRAKAGEKSFAWIHLFDPHAPYDPPAPFAARYARHPYDGEIAYVDMAIGKLIQDLISRNAYKSALITLTSDHGEGLGEHGESTHGLFLYDSTLHVPWILKPPGSKHAGRIVTDPVQGIDLLPTVLQILGISKPETAQGVGQLSAIEGKKTVASRYALGETLLPYEQYGWSPLFSMRSAEHKFIQAPRSELYLLQEDPRENANVVETNASLANRLKQIRQQMATQYSGGDLSGAKVQIHDPEAFQRLLGLGYVAAAGPSRAAPDTSSLADPKDKARIFDLIWEAVEDTESKRYGRAIAKLKEALASDPQCYFARALLGVSCFQMGDFAQAAEQLRDALRLRPQDLIATFYLGMSLSRTGRHESAEQAFRKVLEIDPGNEGALNNLGIVYLNLKRFSESAQIYSQIVKLRPADSFAWTNLGLAYMNLNRNEEAVTALRKAAQINPRMPQIRNNLGLALMNAGQTDQAIAHYREAIALDPGYAQAHYNLAIALKRKGLDREAAIEMDRARKLSQR